MINKQMIISKSKYLSGMQCLKYLWYLINNPESIPEYDEISLFRFQQGHEVGNLAKSLFPDGIEIEHGIDINSEIAKARKLTGLEIDENISNRIEESKIQEIIKKKVEIRRPLFEPAFFYKNAFARADILKPSENDSWDIIEVKSSTSLKDINLHDISFQKYCYEGAGLKVNKCYLMYINKDFIKNGPIDPKDFFSIEDVTIKASELQKEVEKNIDIMLDVIDKQSCPDINLGKQCYNPYECPLRKICWNFLPKNNVFELYRGKDLATYLYGKGIIEISCINEIDMLNPVQRMQYKTVKENFVHIDTKNIGLFLDKLKYPLYFLDFETFATAIPLFDGSRPYQNIPFQYSCHILKSQKDVNPENLYFLAENNGNDPRNDFLDSLKNTLGYKNINNIEDIEKNRETINGSIVVYYENFEKNILCELAKAFPNHDFWVRDTLSRIVDLYEPFKNFYYYNPTQKGSASLKNILPALTGISYDDMEISNGQQASIRYLSTTFLKDDSKDYDKAYVEKIKKDLLDYCGLDTEGMIFILKKLYELMKQ